MKAGLGIALVGGILCFVAMTTEFDPQDPDTIRNMGIYLLSAVVFFAIAGGFSRYAQWSRPLLGGMVFFGAAIVLALFIAKYIPLWFFVSEIVICVFLISCLSSVQLRGYLQKAAERS